MESEGRHHFELWLKAALIAGLAGCIQQAAIAPAQAQVVNYSRDPDQVVASYQVDVGELADDDSGPSVRVYGNGRAEVHVPRYQKGAGDYTTQLTQAEMDELMAALVANGVLEFDPAAVKKAKLDAARQKGGGGSQALFESTDPSITTIELRVRSNSAPSGSVAEVRKSVRWAGLESDAQQFADIAEIRKLAAASQRLKAVMQRADLRPVDRR